MKLTLEKIKSGRARGEDGLKPEMYKALEESDVMIRALKKSMEKILKNSGEPENWKTSRTVMIPQKREPTWKTEQELKLEEKIDHSG